MVTTSRRAVAPSQKGVKGASLRCGVNPRCVKGRPRPARLSFRRRNEIGLVEWGDDPRRVGRIDWRLVRFLAVYTAGWFVLAYIGQVRGR